jgi:hypothetical protein
LCRYDVAKLLNMDHKDPVFEMVLEDIPGDMQWDPANMFEAAFLKNNLKRYDIQYVSRLKAMSKEDSRSSAFSSETTRNPEGKNILANESSSSVKIQVKEFAVLMAKVKVVKDGEPKVAKIAKEIKVFKATLEVNNKPEGRPLIIKHTEHQHEHDLIPTTAKT